jgi:hypothetical protein
MPLPVRTPPRPHLLRLLAWLAGLLLAVAAHAGINLYAPDGMPTGRSVTATELWETFDRNLPPGIWISPLENERYEVVSARWLRRTFLPSLRRQMNDFRTRDLPERGRAANCNGFALVCRVMLNLSAMAARAHGPAAATVIVHHAQAFGGLPATNEYHSVAFVLTDEGPWIIEAQSGAYTPLSAYPNLSQIKLVSVH